MTWLFRYTSGRLGSCTTNVIEALNHCLSFWEKIEKTYTHTPPTCIQTAALSKRLDCIGNLYQHPHFIHNLEILMHTPVAQDLNLTPLFIFPQELISPSGVEQKLRPTRDLLKSLVPDLKKDLVKLIHLQKSLEASPTDKLRSLYRSALLNVQNTLAYLWAHAQWNVMNYNNILTPVYEIVQNAPDTLHFVSNMAQITAHTAQEFAQRMQTSFCECLNLTQPKSCL